jgi:hypothetical protein
MHCLNKGNMRFGSRFIAQLFYPWPYITSSWSIPCTCSRSWFWPMRSSIIGWRRCQLTGNRVGVSRSASWSGSC